MRRTLKFLAAAAVVALPAAGQAQDILVQGTALGCFYLIGGPVCTTFSSLVNSNTVLPGSNITFDSDMFPGGYSFSDFTSAGQLAVGGNNIAFPANNYGKLTVSGPALGTRFNYGGSTVSTCTSAAVNSILCGRLGIGIQVNFNQPTGIPSAPAPAPSVQPVYGTISGSTRNLAGVISGGILVNFDNTVQGPFDFTSCIAQGGGACGAGFLLEYNLNDYNINGGQVGSVPGGVIVSLATPEPASLALMATGVLVLAGVGVARRRSA